MLFLTHLLFGILIALIAKTFLSGGNHLIFFLLVLLGSILPDIDEETSKITKWSGLPGKVISFFSQHRGFFHSLIFITLITLIMKFFFSNYYAWGLFLGLVSHLLGDSLTKSGINFFYPFKGLEMRGWIKTGSLGERVIQIVLVGLIMGKVLF